VKVDSLLVIELGALLLEFLSWILVSNLAKAKESICVDADSLAGASFVHNVNMSFHLVFRLERDITFALAVVVRTQKMGFAKMDLQSSVIFVVHVLVVITTQMAC
jgi:hypothetical protein